MTAEDSTRWSRARSTTDDRGDRRPTRRASRASRASSNPIKLSANENILGCSPAAKAAYLEAAGDLAAYPDGRGAGLRSAIAERYRLEESRIILGTGSDEIFGLLSQVFLGAGDNIVQGEYGFGAYAIAARANEAEVRLAAESQPPHRRRRDAGSGRTSAPVLCGSPTPPIRQGTFLT